MFKLQAQTFMTYCGEKSRRFYPDDCEQTSQ